MCRLGREVAWRELPHQRHPGAIRHQGHRLQEKWGINVAVPTSLPTKELLFSKMSAKYWSLFLWKKVRTSSALQERAGRQQVPRHQQDAPPSHAQGARPSPAGIWQGLLGQAQPHRAGNSSCCSFQPHFLLWQALRKPIGLGQGGRKQSTGRAGQEGAAHLPRVKNSNELEPVLGFFWLRHRGTRVSEACAWLDHCFGKSKRSFSGQCSNCLHPARTTQIPTKLYAIKKTLFQDRRKLLMQPHSAWHDTATSQRIWGPGIARSK